MGKTPNHRKLLFAVVTVLLFLAVAEIAARIAEAFFPPAPVEGRSLLRFQQLFESDPLDTGRNLSDSRDIKTARWAELPGQWFFPEKAEDEFRIVVIGGSAAIGMGVTWNRIFSTKIQTLLSFAAAGKTVRVVNLGKVGFASPQMAHMLETYLPMIRPDLVVSFMGNNEYLDVAAFFGTQEVASGSIGRWIIARKLERHLALARWARPSPRKDFPEESLGAIPALGYDEKIESFVENRLARSLEKIAYDCERNGAKLLVCTVPVNLEHGPGREWFFVSGEEPFPKDYSGARWALRYGMPELAVSRMNKLVARNSDDPTPHLILGRAYKRMNDRDSEKEHYDKAQNLAAGKAGKNGSFTDNFINAAAVCESRSKRECDALCDLVVSWTFAGAQPWEVKWREGVMLSLTDRKKEAYAAFKQSLATSDNRRRATPRVNNTLRTFAESNQDVLFFDLAERIRGYSEGGIPGYDLFLDYCHLNIHGHTIVGHLLADRIAREFGGFATIPSGQVAVALEMNIRKGRVEDIADLRYWAGADFDPTRLVDESVLPPNDLWNLAKKSTKDMPESAEAQMFSGNWYALYGPPGKKEGALDRYKKANTLDPELSASKSNPKWLHKLFD